MNREILDSLLYLNPLGQVEFHDKFINFSLFFRDIDDFFMLIFDDIISFEFI